MTTVLLATMTALYLLMLWQRWWDRNPRRDWRLDRWRPPLRGVLMTGTGVCDWYPRPDQPGPWKIVKRLSWAFHLQFGRGAGYKRGATLWLAWNPRTRCDHKPPGVCLLRWRHRPGPAHRCLFIGFTRDGNNPAYPCWP